MQFWTRHILLLLLCVVLPFGAALWFDTQSEIARSQNAGATSAKIAREGLGARLTLDAHTSVSSAISLAQRISDGGLLPDLNKNSSKRTASFSTVVGLLNEAAPPGGFAWLADGEGRVVAASGQTEAADAVRSIAGHPLFIMTQAGDALDGVWSTSSNVELAAVAPITDRGVANGAVLIVRPVDRGLAQKLSSALTADVTLLNRDRVVATTLGDSSAKEIVADGGNAMDLDAVHGGSLVSPLQHDYLPFLPLFIDARAEGLAYTSLASRVPGAPPETRWVASVLSGESLREIAQRQEIILGVLVASIMLALLIALVNYRTFVTPIDRVSAHLSDIQMGRGDLELPEARVSKPFRRLVRLVNMTVQKMPARSLSAISPPGSGSTPDSIADFSRAPSSAHRSGIIATPFANAPSGDGVEKRATPSVPKAEVPPASPPVDDMLEEPEFLAGPATGPEQSPFEDEDEDEAAAIAAAIASLEAEQDAPVPRAASAAPRLEAPRVPRRASEIRGRSMAPEELPAPFSPSQSEFLRGGEKLSAPAQDARGVHIPAPSNVRGGGSLDLSGYAGIDRDSGSADVEDQGFNPEATVVAPVQEDLLAKSAREDHTDGFHLHTDKPDMTVVASVPPDLLAKSAAEHTGSVRAVSSAENGLDGSDRAHFKEVYERFIDMRKRCGETTGDLAFDRFLVKLTKNRENLIKKYHCRTVRFQVYEKDGKAALKATPVRAR